MVIVNCGVLHRVDAVHQRRLLGHCLTTVPIIAGRGQLLLALLIAAGTGPVIIGAGETIGTSRTTPSKILISYYASPGVFV
jgi:hypothetical protein